MSCLEEDLVLSFVQGRLSPEGVATVDRHVDTCSACRELVAELAKSSLVEDRAVASSEAAPTVDLGMRRLPARPAGGAQTLLSRGTVVGRYVVLRTLGAGGMGVVYAAYDPDLDRKVALKLLRLAVLPPSQLEDARQRLLREAQAMARIEHPNVIAVYDVGTFEGQVFVAMEFVDGWTLGQWLRAAPRSWQDSLDVLAAAGRGLSAAHAAGLVHRDFKPDNVLVGRDGRVLVSDFGLARSSRDAEPIPPSKNADLMPRRGDVLEGTLTQTGAAVGTPAYMAPEQHLGKPTDARCDQWSFCVALYEAIYGERPFRGEGLDVLAVRVASGEIGEPPAGARVPGWLRRVLLRGLRVDPAERYPSMAALLEVLSRDRRRTIGRRILGLAGAAVVVVAALGYGRAAREPPPRCHLAAARLDGVWSVEQKTAIQRAFEATGKPFAADAWRGVERSLDAYAADWAKMRTEACEATYVRGEQSEALLDLRMRCLDRRLGELGALTDLLAHADAEVTQNAVKAAQSLTPLEGCADADALASGMPVPPDGQEVEVAAIETELAEVNALRTAGRYAAAIVSAEDAAAAATRLAWRPLEAEAMLALANAQMMDGDPEAEASMKAAIRAGLAGKQDTLVARAWTSLVYLAGYRGARAEEGHEWARYAEAAIERLSDRADLEVALEVHVGMVLAQEGRNDEAVTRFERAVDRLEKRAPDGLDLVRALDALALAEFDLGDLEGARSLHERARAIREKIFGPDHPEIADSLQHLASIDWAEGRYDRALELYGRARAIAQAALGPDNVAVALIVMNVGVVLLEAGRPAEAIPELERALPVLEKQLGAEHPDTSRARYNLGAAFRHLGRTADAERELRRALAAWEHVLSPGQMEIAMALYELGELRRVERRWGDALELYQRALEIFEKIASNHQGVGYALAGIGEVYLAQGAPGRAVPPLERAAMLQAVNSFDPVRRSATWFSLARALRGSGQNLPRADFLAHEARDLLAGSGERGEKQLAEVDAWLSR